jgi:DNA-binding NarL/FixJ family response regulator
MTVNPRIFDRREGGSTMLKPVSFDSTAEARSIPQLFRTGRHSEEIDAHHTHGESSAEVCDFIAIVESRLFLRECIGRSLQSAFTAQVIPYSTVFDLETRCLEEPLKLIVLSLSEGNTQSSANALNILSELVPSVPVIVLAYKNDTELARTAITHGAKGYIPATMGFEIAIEAVRFVLAGGTYVPIECLATGWPGAAPSQPPSASGLITSRQLAVVRAIHQGKSNKVIAYDLRMCESTVKVHVRHIMKKLKAKNRTDVAIKSSELLTCTKCIAQSECWSAARCSKRIVAGEL